jgi:hypothetical protein
MNDERAPWGPFDLDAWQGLPHLRGRLATEEDVLAGSAVFHQAGSDPTRGPADVPLPRRARLGSDGPEVVIIQAEWARGAVVVGYRDPAGGNGIALLEELELSEER